MPKKLVSIQAGHSALIKSSHQRIEVFAELVFTPTTPTHESTMHFGEWLLPNPIADITGQYQAPAKIHVELETKAQPCQFEVFGFGERNQPVNEMVSFTGQKVRESTMTYKTISYLVYKGGLPPKITIGKAGKDGRRFLPTAWANTWPTCTSIQFIGFLHSDHLQSLVFNRLRQDQEYRIRWYRNQVHTIKAVELNPLAKLFNVANELDQT